MFKYIFLVIFALSCGNIFSQDDVSQGIDDDDLEMDDYVKSKQELAKKADELTVKGPDMGSLQSKIAGMAKNVDLDKLSNLDLDDELARQMDEFRAKFIKEFHENNPFSKMDRKQIEDVIKEKASGTKLGDILSTSPKAMDLLVNIIRDDRALPYMLGILNQRHKMQVYGYVSLVLFIATLLMNMFVRKKKQEPFYLRWSRTIFMQAVLSVGLFIFFYILFRRELEPLMMVAVETFFGNQVS